MTNGETWTWRDMDIVRQTWIFDCLTVTRSDIPQQHKFGARFFIHKYLAFRM